MKKAELTAKELKEPVFVTLGRLSRAIKDGHAQDRQLNLLNKIFSDCSQMDIELMQLKK